MSELKVIKIEPLDLPADVVRQISGSQHIALRDFYVYVQKAEAIMYVNAIVPEKDVEKFIKAATYKGNYILDDTTEIGRLMDYIYETYGSAAHNSLYNYYQYKTERKEEQRAKEKVQNMIPSIEKLIKTKKFDENMIYEAYSAGDDRKGETSKNRCGFRNIYTYCLGYLVGSGALKEDYSPENSGNVIDYYYEITEMLEHIDIREMPKIYGYLNEMYFSGESEA